MLEVLIPLKVGFTEAHTRIESLRGDFDLASKKSKRIKEIESLSSAPEFWNDRTARTDVDARDVLP